MDKLNRRKALQVLGAAGAAAGISWTEAEAQQAHQHAQQARRNAAAAKTAYKPKYFTAHELATVTMLANLIIPKDEKSGNASDAGVPEFIDFMMIDQPQRQLLMRGGIKWLDRESRKRFSQLQAAHAGHDHVAENDIVRIRSHQLQRLLARDGASHLVTQFGQQVLRKGSDLIVILDDKDRGGRLQCDVG